MAIPRTASNLGRTVLRRAATQSRTQAWRQAARRHASTGTASAEKAKKTSDIPWIIGSVAFTVPAAVWLLGQGPQKSDHHEAAHEAEPESKEEEEAPAEESTEDKSEGDAEEKSEDKSDEKSDDSSGDEKKESEGDGDNKKSEDSSSESSEGGDGKDTPDTSGDDEYEKPGPNAPGQINYKSSMKRGPGENQKGGERAKSETSGEKNGDKSGAKHPYLDDDEKSKKGEGLKETQRIHGTVSSDRPLR